MLGGEEKALLRRFFGTRDGDIICLPCEEHHLAFVGSGGSHS